MTADRTAAERNRRSRQNRREGMRVLNGRKLAVDPDSIAVLVQRGAIPAWAAHRDDDLLEAISHLLDDLAEEAR